MDDTEARVRDLQQQAMQLDLEAKGSALTPGEAEKNTQQRQAVLDELRGLGASEHPGGGAAG